MKKRDTSRIWSVAHRLSAVALVLVTVAACTSNELSKGDGRIESFAKRYTAAWCSQNAASVAEFFAEDGSLTINDGDPSVGRAAIARAAQGFMAAFPDMVVSMDEIRGDGERAVYRWTLTGTNSGPGGTGRSVKISGYEEWTFGTHGLITTSTGHFDEVEYQRQLTGGVGVR